MAAELVITGTFTYNKTGVNITKTYDQTIDVGSPTAQNPSVMAVQQIGIAPEAVGIGEVGKPEYCIFHNLEAEGGSAIVLGDGTVFCVILKPGDWAVLRWNLSTIQAKALSAPSYLEYGALPA